MTSNNIVVHILMLNTEKKKGDILTWVVDRWQLDSCCVYVCSMQAWQPGTKRKACTKVLSRCQDQV